MNVAYWLSTAVFAVSVVVMLSIAIRIWLRGYAACREVLVILAVVVAGSVATLLSVFV
ncbi:MAG: hypothetical protein ACLP0J_00910 [Solirubrobacteraceae bacterium]